jgi:hypothetical protein
VVYASQGILFIYLSQSLSDLSLTVDAVKSALNFCQSSRSFNLSLDLTGSTLDKPTEKHDSRDISAYFFLSSFSADFEEIGRFCNFFVFHSSCSFTAATAVLVHQCCALAWVKCATITLQLKKPFFVLLHFLAKVGVGTFDKCSKVLCFSKDL